MLKAQRSPVASVDGPEAELLLCCAQIGEDSERAVRIRALLHKEIDWPYLLRTARAHGMMPLLYWHLNTNYPDVVPKTAMDELQDGRFRTMYAAQTGSTEQTLASSGQPDPDKLLLTRTFPRRFNKGAG